MNKTANLYANIYDHVVSSRINCLDEVLLDETLGRNKCFQERNLVNGNKVSKMKDYDWLQRLIEFAAPIADTIKWNCVNEHGVCDVDMGAPWGAPWGVNICTNDSTHFQDYYLGQENQAVLNKRNLVVNGDMTSIRSEFENDNNLFDDGGLNHNSADRDTDYEINMGTDLKNNYIQSNIPTSTSTSCSVSSVTMVNNSPRDNEFNENYLLKNYIIDKDVKISELLMQLKLARHTINQQQCVIHDLEKKLGNIVGNVDSGSPKEEADKSVKKSQLELCNVIKPIHAQNDELRNNESLIEELNASETLLKLQLEDGKKRRNQLEDSIGILRGIIYQLQVNNFIYESQTGTVSDTDVLILHDAFLKHIKTDLFKKQQLIMENILCHRLSDALLNLQMYREKPEVVIVHAGTNDLASLQVEEMCSIVRDIHACVTNNGMKLIICNITPCYDESELESKVHLFNSNISHRLGVYDNVTVCKGDDLNFRGILLQEYVNGCTREKQINNLDKIPRNKRFSPYQTRGKENVNRPAVKDTFHKQPRTV